MVNAREQGCNAGLARGRLRRSKVIGTLCSLVMAGMLAGCGPDGEGPQAVAEDAGLTTAARNPAPGGGSTTTVTKRAPEIGQSMGIQVQAWYLGPNDLSMIEAMGFSTLRWGIEWSQVERTQGVYDWTATDDLVQRLRATGLSSIVILAYGNTLYSGTFGAGPNAPSTPQGRAAFARFAAEAARRYADAPITWEIWNEPDSPTFWIPEPDYSGYAALAAEACPAIKTADPTAQVIGAASAALPNATTWQPVNLYSTLAQSPALSCLDVISGHAYRMNADYTSPGPDSVKQDIEASKTYLYNTLGVPGSKPFYVTEWGWPTSVVSPDLQIAYIMRGTLANLASDIGMTVWYEWRNSRAADAGHEAFFGIFPYQGSAKASQPVIDSLAALAQGSYVGPVTMKRPDGEAAMVTANGKTYVYAWLDTADMNYSANLVIDGRKVGPVDFLPRAYAVKSTRVSVDIVD